MRHHLINRQAGRAYKKNAEALFCGIILLSVCMCFSAYVILNEYNAVDNAVFLNGGNSSADVDGGRASDSYFGRIAGNGGDWFELVVITDHLDMRNWRLDIYEAGAFSETLTLTNHGIWSDLRSGTIITVSEDVPGDISYNPAAGDWWINVQANSDANGTYITASNFTVSKDNWQLRIRDASGIVKFGPVGEGISPASGISGTEVFKLKADPSASIIPASTDYGDGHELSTFGAPNQWGLQNLNQLRTVVAQPSALILLSPDDSNTLMAGTIWPINWQSTGTIADVTIEFSIDDGKIWSAVFPQNTGNSGNYNWLVPMVDSTQCLIRAVNTANPAVFDTSGTFTISQCPLQGDLDGNCKIDLLDFALMASGWLQSFNP
jgi:hypothetical protein